MKNICLLIFLAFCPVLLNAQALMISEDNKFIPVEPQRVDRFLSLDTARLIVTYEVAMLVDTSSKLPEIDIQILQIGKKYAKSYSKLLYEGDSIYFSYMKKGVRSAPWFQEDVPPVEIYKNYKKRQTTVGYRLFGTKTVYLYEDDFPAIIDWTLTSEKKKILSYTCQKAIGSFRGRTYEAWFTPEIPLEEGPYKFSGLPGLILEVSDTEKQYVYSCIGIEQPKSIVPIKYWKWRYEKIERKKLFHLIERAHKSPFRHLKLGSR